MASAGPGPGGVPSAGGCPRSLVKSALRSGSAPVPAAYPELEGEAAGLRVWAVGRTVVVDVPDGPLIGPRGDATGHDAEDVLSDPSVVLGSGLVPWLPRGPSAEELGEAEELLLLAGRAARAALVRDLAARLRRAAALMGDAAVDEAVREARMGAVREVVRG